MSEEPEKLFLLEFLVDSVYVHRHCGQEIGAAEWMMCGPTIVTFQFMTFPILEIVETDFPPKGCPGSEPQTFESGKSCLFSLPDRVLRNAPPELIINVGVAKKLPSGCVPDTLRVGAAKIDLTDEFHAVVGEIFSNPNTIPASKSRRDRFVLKSVVGRELVGQIHLFIRLSCFGKLIITQFTLASGKSYLFKGTADKLFKCDELDENVPYSEPCVPGTQLLPCSTSGAGELGNAGPCNVFQSALEANASLPCQWLAPQELKGLLTSTPDKCGPGQNVACYKITKGQDGDKPPMLGNEGKLCKSAVSKDEPYVLRIGKRCTKGCDEKEQLELELRAPPQRYKDTKETQWEDVAGEGKKGKKDKKGKGKKGKGKKGKKGKKK